MATLEDLLTQSNQTSPIQPLHSTTLPEITTSAGNRPFIPGKRPSGPTEETSGTMPGGDTWSWKPSNLTAMNQPGFGETGEGDEEGYQWDTQPAEYEFGTQRIGQSLDQVQQLGYQAYMGSAGPDPVRQAVWKKDIRSSGGAGGQVFRDYSDETFDYNKRVVAAEEAKRKQEYALQEKFAKQRWEQQQQQLGLSQQYLEEREPLRHPIADLL